MRYKIAEAQSKQDSSGDIHLGNQDLRLTGVVSAPITVEEACGLEVLFDSHFASGTANGTFYPHHHPLYLLICLQAFLLNPKHHSNLYLCNPQTELLQ